MSELMNTKGVEDGIEIFDMKQALLEVCPEMEVLPVVHAGHFGEKPYWEVFADKSDEAKTLGIGESWTAAVFDAYKRLPELRSASSTPAMKDEVESPESMSTGDAAREKVLMEALKSVENERLEKHHDLVKMEFINQADISDAAYSRAIRDAEEAIKALMHIEGKAK